VGYLFASRSVRGHRPVIVRHFKGLFDVKLKAAMAFAMAAFSCRKSWALKEGRVRRFLQGATAWLL